MHLGSGRRWVRRVELGALVILIAVAGYLWTAPWRAERALRHASFNELRAASRRDPNNPRVFYYLGVRLRDLGQLGPARAAFARAASLDPDSEEIWLAWGTTASAFGSEQEAFQALSACVQKHPESGRAHLTLALFCHEHYALQRAYDEARAATKDDPRDAGAWRLAGVTALQLQDPRGAEAALRQAVTLAPRDWRSRLALAQALTVLHRPDEALREYQEASRLAPEQPEITLALGQAQLVRATGPTGVEAARQTLAQAVAQDPSAAAQFALSLALIRQQRWGEACLSLQHAEPLAPSNAGIHFELARVYRHLGDSAAADHEILLHQRIKSYEEARLSLGSQARTSNDPAVRLKLARLYASHGDFREAILEYRTLIAHASAPAAATRELAALESQHPEMSAAPAPAEMSVPATAPADAVSIDALLHDADTILAHDRYPEAEQAYLRIVARDPQCARAFQGLGLAMVAQGKTAEAFRALDRALKLDPKLTEAQFTLAHLYYDQGFVDEAERRMEVLTRQVPDNGAYLHALAVCSLDDSSRYLQTEQLLKRAVALSPDKPVYLRDLAKIEANLSKSQEAENAYRKALALGPDDRETLVALGSFLLDHQPTVPHQQEAERLLTRAVALQADNADALLGLGRLALQHNDAKKAVATLQNAVAHNPNLAPAWYHLARAYDRVGDLQRAEDSRKAFHDITTYRQELSDTEERVRAQLKDPALRLKLARLYAQGGQNGRAINQYQVCLSLDRGNVVARQELETLTRRLQAGGQMPSMDALNGMLLASIKVH